MPDINATDEIIKSIEKMSGKYTPYTIFSDWVKMTAISIQNACDIFHGKIWKEREKQYRECAGKYTQDEIIILSGMFELLTMAFESNGIYDYLGDIFMRSGAGSKMTGQFFTPFHLSELTGVLGLNDVEEERIIEINEPSAGGGGMILAAAKVLHDKGINYQKYLKVTAQDLDWNGVYMTYIQLSLIGIKAIVVQGNTLSAPCCKGCDELRIFRTPAEMGAII